jgi:hypothetical protein
VLREVLVDELGERRPPYSVLAPELLKRSIERRPRVNLASEASALNAY